MSSAPPPIRRVPPAASRRRVRRAIFAPLLAVSSLAGAWTAALEAQPEDCRLECRPLPSVVALVLADDGGTGASSIPELVKARVAQYAAGSLPAGARFPIANDSTDSVRTLPEISLDVVVGWLDPLGEDDSPAAPRFGANCDFLAFFGDGWDVDWADGSVGSSPRFAGSSTSGWLWANHEHISNASPSLAGAPAGQHLTLAKHLAEQGVLAIDVAEPGWPQDAIDTYIEHYKRQLGGSWLRIVQDGESRRWRVDRSAANVRFDATSSTLLTVTGHRLRGPEHDDRGRPLAAGVVPGIMGDCAGSQSPWGTVITAEENVQIYYGDLEACWTSNQRFIEGTGFDPGRPIDPPLLAARGSAWRAHSSPSQHHSRECYGFLNEIDLAAGAADAYDSIRTGGDGAGQRKIGSLGRARWESCTFAVGPDWRLAVGRRIVIYATDDRRGGRIYKWVSDQPFTGGMTKPQVRALLDAGTLHVAHFADLDNRNGWMLRGGVVPDESRRGSGRWIHLGVGSRDIAPNAAALGDPERTVGAALADVDWNGLGGFADDDHVRMALFTASNKIGVRELNRPEDIEYDPLGPSGAPRVYVAFSNHDRQVALDDDGVLFDTAEHAANSPSRGDTLGSIFAIEESAADDPAASAEFTFFLVWRGSRGRGPFDAAIPDNLALDAQGGLWFATDGNFGVNRSADAIYYLDLDPAHAEGSPGVTVPSRGLAFRVVTGPADSEPTGPTFSPDMRTLFFSVQHPGASVGSASVWPNEHFELSFAGPRRLGVAPRSTVTREYVCRLAHAGEGAGAQAWSYGVTALGASIDRIELDGTEAWEIARQQNDGFTLHELTGGGAVASVVLSLGSAVSLPANSLLTVSRLGVAVETGDEPEDDGVILRFAPGTSAAGEPIPLEVERDGRSFVPRTSELAIELTLEPAFVRGDADQDRRSTIADSISILGFLFRADATALACLDAADADDNGAVDISDGIFHLLFLFAGGAAPGSPYPGCGTDPTSDELTCSAHVGCE